MPSSCFVDINAPVFLATGSIPSSSYSSSPASLLVRSHPPPIVRFQHSPMVEPSIPLGSISSSSYGSSPASSWFDPSILLVQSHPSILLWFDPSILLVWSQHPPGMIPESVESERRQMKQCGIKYWKKSKMFSSCIFLRLYLGVQDSATFSEMSYMYKG